MSKGNSMSEESVKIQRTRQMPLRYRAQPFMTPWAIMGMVFVASVITRLLASGPVALIFLTLMVSGLGMVTWATWGRRHEHARNAATAYVVGMGLWLTLATAVGPWTEPMIYSYVIGGSFLCLTWNIRHAGITPTNQHDKVKTGPVDPISLIKGLKNTVTGKARTVADGAGKRVEVILNHPGGKNTTSDVQRKKENVAGLYGVPSSNVKVTESGTQGSAQTRVVVRLEDPTDKVLLWRGVSAPGKSISAAPLRTGGREDGKEAFHWITGNDEESRAASATLYSGMTGAGKTEAFILAVLEMISRTDCAPPVIADPEKLMLSFGHILNVFDIAADGPEQTNQLISNLPEAMRYRARLLGSLGYHRGWVPECYTKHGIPVQPIHIEEAGGYLASNQDFNRALTLCRALGMPISISLQVAVFRQLQRESRSQFGNSLAFGVREAQDAKFALLDETLRAGADPTKWANNHPGCHYGEITGVPSDEWSVKRRTFKITVDETLASIEASRSAGWAKCDPGTFALLGKGIERPQRMIVQAPVWGDVVPVDRPPAEDPWDQVTTTEDASQAPTLEIIQGGDEATRPEIDEARDLITAQVDACEQDGQEIVTIADFHDIAEILGRHRTWPYIELNRLAKAGRLERLEGPGRRYRIIPRDQKRA
jgi:hypothetical protein